ncbi:MAG TPA: nuclear transport factor 2 family protein [Candidatus Dormibacteraeota bacterium]|nr:nuclear transport factor 2 family protein [Candidatus Dormibacteraeota bacterium]
MTNSRHRANGAALLFILTGLGGCVAGQQSVQNNKVREFAVRYTAAWCSQDPQQVAAFFAPRGSLSINGGTPASGREAIAHAAHGFMSAFPDLRVSMDDVSGNGTHAVYRWTLTGTNTGPGGTGNAVRISGYEEWTLGTDGLIASSLGHFDAAEYQRQLTGGAAQR